ncbi:hypothetical protein ACIQNU_23365 [Streptomyces sp. NPDC091292]|uniref:hypothetical protein n=1 Tax=Streptomyces sp. NPDC091292 TaxID=3365991 RepID=UPI003806E62D
MDLWPLYSQNDYASFGCLFGVRNYAGHRPLAADRGLPDDLSSSLRAQLEPWVAQGAMTGATWVSWADIAGLDPASGPEYYAGRLTWSSPSLPSTRRQQLVPAAWPPELVAEVGPRPHGLDGADSCTEWITDDLRCTYEPLTAGAVLGGESHWRHVFAVMKALAERFGAEDVRLVAAFD